ncbi:MAG: rhodanese-like domain-containing protein [Luteolibacter sp.]
MKSRASLSLIAATALILGACAPQESRKTTAPTPAKPLPAKVEKKPETAYKKPVRMNGRGKIGSISLEEFFALHQADQVMLYDARPAFFYRLGHIPGAINLPVHNNDVDTPIHRQEAEIKAALAKGKTIVTYCTGITCPDARSLAIHFSGFGYPVKIFSGGWNAWKDAGMPTE